jgi:hypothetical protein
VDEGKLPGGKWIGGGRGILIRFSDDLAVKICHRKIIFILEIFSYLFYNVSK